MSNQCITALQRLPLRRTRKLRLAIIAALLVAAPLVGCRIWDPDQPGGKTPAWSGLSGVPKQSEPVVDPDATN